MKAKSSVLIAIICIMQALAIPATANAVYVMGGTSSTAQTGGGQISGNFAQITYTDSIAGQKDLVARIWSEVSVAEGQTGSASVEWIVPKSSVTSKTQSSLTVSAYGTAASYVEKTSKLGTAYALGDIMSNSHAGSGLPSGSAEINSKAYITGTGHASASANGSASFSATSGVYTVSGSVKGKTEINAENIYGGKVSNDAGSTDPAFAVIRSSSAVASPGSIKSDVNGETQLASRRGAIFSGDSKASASVSGMGSADSQVTSPVTVAHAGLTGVNMSATVSAYDVTDWAEADVNIDPAAGLAPTPAIYASNSIGLSSSVGKGCCCCSGGEMALATATLIDAEWDASSTRYVGDLWETCLSGATGLPRDGSNLPTEPGFATGATILEKSSEIKSGIISTQRADANAAGPSTSSGTTLSLAGPAYSSTGSIDDAAGARFAIDFEEMSATNGNAIDANGDTVLHTNIAGPDAYLWITSDNKKVINGHYADDGLSIYDIVFEPVGMGEVAGPEIAVTGLRKLSLKYETGQPAIT
jgi:hypothetical protein